MESQLSNFSRNKKKMAPYDIKPTPNPKIEPNLHFFLKDPNAQPPPEVSIKIQTDDFKERPTPPPYKPKKTGINTATQIEQNELFSFDKEVKPILAILTTKALENAALEIEEEEELLKMAKYKAAYEDRVKKQKEHEQKNI
jgi:radial spoke head protein 3